MASKPGQVDGFVRVAAAVPPVRVTDFTFNREQTLALWRQANDDGCALAIFPELGLAAYTAGDLHMDQHLLAQSLASLEWLADESKRLDLRTIAFVGLPLFVHPGVFNVAVGVQAGRILGAVPKAYLPNYGEFYERRQFRQGRDVSDGATIK